MWWNRQALVGQTLQHISEPAEGAWVTKGENIGCMYLVNYCFRFVFPTLKPLWLTVLLRDLIGWGINSKPILRTFKNIMSMDFKLFACHPNPHFYGFWTRRRGWNRVTFSHVTFALMVKIMSTWFTLWNSHSFVWRRKNVTLHMWYKLNTLCKFIHECEFKSLTFTFTRDTNKDLLISLTYIFSFCSEDSVVDQFYKTQSGTRNQSSNLVFFLQDVWDISVQSTFQTCFLSALKTDEMSH